MAADHRSHDTMKVIRPPTAEGARLCFESVWDERNGRKIAVFPVSSDDPAEDEHAPDEHLFVAEKSVIEDVTEVR